MLNIERGVAALRAYDFGFLRERYADENPRFADRFDEVAGEYRKFLTLPLHCDGPLAMPSEHPVDKYWHTHLQHTQKYMEFCDEVYGRCLHHQPNSDLFPVAKNAMPNLYAEFPKYNGPMSELWFEGIPEAYVIAMKNGHVPEAVLALKWSGWPGWI